MSGGESPRLGEGSGTLKAAPRHSGKPKKMNSNPNTQSARSQRAKIRKHLEDGNTINAMAALNLFGCFRLGARISELRNDEGLEVKDRWITLIRSHKKVKEYYMDVVKEIAE